MRRSCSFSDWVWFHVCAWYITWYMLYYSWTDNCVSIRQRNVWHGAKRSFPPIQASAASSPSKASDIMNRPRMCCTRTENLIYRAEHEFIPPSDPQNRIDCYPHVSNCQLCVNKTTECLTWRETKFPANSSISCFFAIKGVRHMNGPRMCCTRTENLI